MQFKRIPEFNFDFGPCCACGKEDPSVRNILQLYLKTPVPGTGWGCVVCGTGLDGAVAVICDECREKKMPLKFAVNGFVAKKERVPIGDLTQRFEHDLLLHKLTERAMSLPDEEIKEA